MKPVITPESKIIDLLDDFPLLEDVLIEIAPVFSKLKNPILRRTIAKVTSIRQAAAVGNIQLGEMIIKLRRSAGQEIYNSEKEMETIMAEHNLNDAKEPNYKNVVLEYDARKDLESGIHPVGKVMSDIHNLNEGEQYLLITPFTPAPLIDKAKAKGFKAESFMVDEETYKTYFYK